MHDYVKNDKQEAFGKLIFYIIGIPLMVVFFPITIWIWSLFQSMSIERSGRASTGYFILCAVMTIGLCYLYILMIGGIK